ncbi:PREDICTED: transmembrane protein 238 [Dipodomys ordii]|uniref:Transmembrane protein 238 n=1 Tax=Dipodomys ordii TaxID=10020 RepID=A0A1S3ERS5_DIPOR|nr:PREDICTED: transmembrane protein 238 [Dipodomys ordii]
METERPKPAGGDADGAGPLRPTAGRRPGAAAMEFSKKSVEAAGKRSGLGRCRHFFWLGVAFDTVGATVLLTGVFADLLFYDVLLYLGAIILFISLLWWISWYTGNIELLPDDDDDDALPRDEHGDFWALGLKEPRASPSAQDFQASFHTHPPSSESIVPLFRSLYPHDLGAPDAERSRPFHTRPALYPEPTQQPRDDAEASVPSATRPSDATKATATPSHPLQ